MQVVVKRRSVERIRTKVRRGERCFVSGLFLIFSRCVQTSSMAHEVDYGHCDVLTGSTLAQVTGCLQVCSIT